MDALDAAYVFSLLVILLGGAVCIAVFGSREKTKRDLYSNSYRFKKADGEIVRAKGKPSLFERKSRYYYLERSPFSADASAEDIKAPDGRRYKAIALFTLHAPDDTALLAAESFFGLSTEEIADMLADPLEAALRGLIEEVGGEADFKRLAADFRARADQAVARFGVSVFGVNEIRVVAEDDAK
ncbi:MAG: hypothetical protein NC084_08910 [Bacteroides sp.]|nr:hypothetical protein [Eubacterium sp.]MCM1418334.1 hypothetical protein [Roseburia sp.]MCM1462816.1 hypothetical protein [Bacteroides sp.]